MSIGIVEEANSQEAVKIPDISSVTQQVFAANPGTGTSNLLDVVVNVFEDNPFEYKGTNASTRSKVMELIFLEALSTEARAPISE